MAAADAGRALSPRAAQAGGSAHRQNRAWVEQLPLPAPARGQITVALRVIDAVDCEVAPIEKQLARTRAARPAVGRSRAHYGIGALTSVVILAELGDARRFSSSREAVRYGGLDITVHASDSAARPGISPGKDRPCCAGRCMRPRRPRAAQAPRPRLLPASRRAPRHNRACLAITRKLLKRSYHTLRELGDEALAPA